MKKFLSVVLCASIALTPAAVVLANVSAPAEIQTAELNGPKEYSISLSEAIAMAYDNNAQLNANLLTQKGNELSISSARISMRASKDIPANMMGAVSSNFELLCVKRGYYVKAAEMSHRISQKEYDKIKADIAYDVTEGYYRLVLMEKLYNAALNSYNLAIDNKKVVDAQYSLGLIPELDYENAGIAVLSAMNALNEYKMNYEIAEQSLKILINKDSEDCTIIPTDEIECEIYTGTPETDIEAAMETRFDINSLKERRDLAGEYFEISKALQEGSAGYNTAYASYMTADYNYTNTKKLISLSIKSSYNNVLSTGDKMETARLQYEMELKKYDAAKLKFELGMITNLELTACINDLYNAQVNYANSKLNYRLAVEKYKYEITIGL